MKKDALPSGRIQICASDISGKALRIAAQGAYTAERCRELPAAWLSRYFVADGRPPKNYQVGPELRRHATFHRVNLMDRFSWPHSFAFKGLSTSEPTRCSTRVAPSGIGTSRSVARPLVG